MFDFDNAEPAVGLGAFLDWLWGSVDGYAHVAYADPKKETDWNNRKAVWPKGRDKVIDFILSQDKLGMNVYVGPALFDIGKYDLNPGYGKENVLGSYVYWSEYDGTAPALGATETDATPTLVVGTGDGSEAVRMADTPQGRDNGIPPPSLRIQSGHEGHEHHYWKSETFITDKEALEKVNRSITYASIADTSGWDCNQVLRPPYTKNHKYADKPPVTVTYVADEAYLLEAFNKVPPVKELISRSIDTDALPSLEGILIKYAWDKETYEFFSREKIPEGERSTALMKLGYECAENGLDESEIYTVLQNADDRWGKYVGRADRKIRLLDIVNRALAKHPKSLISTTFEGLRNLDVNGNSIEIIQQAFDFINTEMAEQEWVIENFLERQGIGLVASAPGVGKTQLSLQLAYECALGGKFLQWNIPQPLKTLMFSLEMSPYAMHKFMTTQLASYPNFTEQQMINNNFAVANVGHSISIASEDNRKFVTDAIEKYRPDGVIFDSLGKLTNTKLDEEVSRKISNFLDEIKIRYGCFVWLIHHNRKSNSDNRHPTRLDDIFGSTYITANVSAAMSLYKPDPKSDIQVYVNKLRMADVPDPFTIKRGPNLLFSESGIIPQFEHIGGDKNAGDGRADSKRG